MIAQIYPAYEKWLLSAANSVHMTNNELDVKDIVSIILRRDCMEQHAMAFDIVGSINEDGSITHETFDKAAELILSRN